MADNRFFIIHNLTVDRKTLSQGLEAVYTALGKIADYQGVPHHEVKADLYTSKGGPDPLASAVKVDMTHVRQVLKERQGDK